MDLAAANNFKILALLVLGYIWVQLIKVPVCFSSFACLFTWINIFNLFIIIFFSWFLIKVVNDAGSSDQVQDKINEATLRKIELEIKELEYKQLVNNQSNQSQLPIHPPIKTQSRKSKL